MHLCFKMLNTGRRKLNTTTTQLSPFTHNDFTLICNDVTKPTVHTSQFRCFGQNGPVPLSRGEDWTDHWQHERGRPQSSQLNSFLIQFS